jgi:hypothetical protein
MAEKSKKFGCWVHVKITNKELVEKLDEMSNSDERDRSKFIRWLIQQEWTRRNSQTFFADNPSTQNVEKIVTSCGKRQLPIENDPENVM